MSDTCLELFCMEEFTDQDSLELSEQACWQELIASSNSESCLPFLQTLQVRRTGFEIDFKIVPYEYDFRQIHVTLQRVGESRPVSSHGPQADYHEPAAATNDDMLSVDPLPDADRVRQPSQELVTGASGSAAAQGSPVAAVEEPPQVRCTWRAPRTHDLAGGRARMAARIAAKIDLKHSNRMLPCFDPTPRASVHLGIGEALSHMNLGGIGCCNLHIGAMTLQSVIVDMLGENCKANWTPNSGWQCRVCHSVHDECDVDGEEAADVELSRWCHICSMEDRPILPRSVLSDISSHRRLGTIPEDV